MIEVSLVRVPSAIRPEKAYAFMHFLRGHHEIHAFSVKDSFPKVIVPEVIVLDTTVVSNENGYFNTTFYRVHASVR